jgi:MFS family permease
LSKKSTFDGVTKNSVLLAFASLFGDISTEMLYPIMPIYLTQYLHVSGSIVGLIDGLALATQNIVQGLSGYLSDRWHRRKPIALCGYFLSAISKPMMGLSLYWPYFFAARLSDRIGAGTRSAPRDALIASSVEDKHRGKAFGLEGLGDNLGAFLGPLISLFLFFSLKLEIQSIFYIAAIPGILAFIMTALVIEKINYKIKSKISITFKHFPTSYWKYIFVTAIFGIGNSSNAFLILEIQNKGLSLSNTIFIYSLFNLVAALISYPAGVYSDRIGRKPLLLLGFGIFLVTYAGFAFTSNIYFLALLFILYGLFQGIFRSVGKSLAADFVDDPIRASAIGWYSTTVGLSGLVASLIAGLLWDNIGHETVFFLGCGSSIFGIASLIVLVKQKPNEK